MGVQRRDRNDRVTSGAPPRLKVSRDASGAVRVEPDHGEAAEPTHPETTAEERPPQADDPRPALWRDVGGPYGV